MDFRLQVQTRNFNSADKKRLLSINPHVWFATWHFRYGSWHAGRNTPAFPKRILLPCLACKFVKEKDYLLSSQRIREGKSEDIRFLLLLNISVFGNLHYSARKLDLNSNIATHKASYSSSWISAAA
ncbi:hypothetical protein NPIL_359721 [Nephila pilipes]|uniref:Uncharacterized protein n=1 Tax=Nephila pilipes TaxID=299642 RepID=A0A8X6IXS0_NEPPI|nr:hypothetical protein NPIL_359721 [Nephila pilipes]